MTTGFDLRSAVAHARLFLDMRDVQGALAQLERALPDLESARATVDDSVAEAACLYASVLVAADEPEFAQTWAELAYRTYRTRTGPASAASLHAASVLGHVLTVTEERDRAVELYAELVSHLPAQFGPGHRQVFNGQADYALALHRVGRCAVGRELLGQACREHDRIFGPGDRDGIKMLARLGSMRRDCRDFDGAHELFSEAKARCRAHLETDDPLGVNVARLARDAADATHECRPEPAPGAAKATFNRRLRWRA